jgi:hypothetical protein
MRINIRHAHTYSAIHLHWLIVINMTRVIVVLNNADPIWLHYKLLSVTVIGSQLNVSSAGMRLGGLRYGWHHGHLLCLNVL